MPNFVTTLGAGITHESPCKDRAYRRDYFPVYTFAIMWFDNPFVKENHEHGLFKECLLTGCRNATNGFADLTAAQQWVHGFVRWYNHEHRHSAIRFVTPMQRHAGEDKAILANRHALNLAARAAHPERWSSGTRNWEPRTLVSLNPERTVVTEAVQMAA